MYICLATISVLLDLPYVGMEHSSGIFLWVVGRILSRGCAALRFSSLCGGTHCPPPSSTVPTIPPHGGDQGWALSEAHMSCSLLWFSLNFFSQDRKIFHSVRCSSKVCSSTATYSVVSYPAWLIDTQRSAFDANGHTLFPLCGSCN